MQNLTNRMLVNINFQLDASDFIYVKYDVLINTCLLFYLQEDLTSLREILPDFHEIKYLHKNVRLKVVRENAGELFSACVKKFLFRYIVRANGAVFGRNMQCLKRYSEEMASDCNKRILFSRVKL